MTRLKPWILALVLLLSLVQLTPAATAQYRLTQIVPGTTADGMQVAPDPTDFSDRDEISLVAFTDSVHSYVWREGVLTEVTHVIDPNASYVDLHSINRRGDWAGSHTIGPDLRGFLFIRDRLIDVIGDPAELGVQVLKVNDLRQVLALSIDARTEHPFLWQRGHAEFLLPAPGDDGSGVFALNNRGVVAGVSGNRPAIWDHGNVMPLPLPPGSTSAVGNAISDRDVVTVSALFDDHRRAFLWRDGEYQELPLLFPERQTSSGAGKMNRSGDIAGGTTSQDPVTGRFTSIATLWHDNRPIDINSLVAPNDPLRSHVTLTGARINELGHIFAGGTDDRSPDTTFYYLLTPAP
jgi:hypothetical protein